MSKVVFELATQTDEEDLLRLMADNPMPGLVRIAYRREPSFLDSLCIQGNINQTIIGRHSSDGRVGGMGTRSIKPAYMNGHRKNLGYLGNLRVAERYRGMVYLARGYQVFKELHQDGLARLYLSSMLVDNEPALNLTKGRAYLPAYHNIGLIHGLAISLSQCRRVKSAPVTVRRAEIGDVGKVVEFLNREGKKRQFFPCYSVDDFVNGNGLLKGLSMEDILIAIDGDEIVGIVAAWDQKAFRQSVVIAYARWLSYLRPLYNLSARTMGLPKLPKVGEALDYCYLSLVCIRSDSQEVFMQLIGELMRLNRGRFSFLMAGLHESDPLLPSLMKFRGWKYLSRLFCVCWEDGKEEFSALDGRCPYIELGAL